ncbi:hypothetical protein DIPPA_05200 [Diplonema papillatum]|nr:hypothetical protein DIPPA_05200 [Diplonema papillatum]
MDQIIRRVEQKEKQKERAQQQRARPGTPPADALQQQQPQQSPPGQVRASPAPQGGVPGVSVRATFRSLKLDLDDYKTACEVTGKPQRNKQNKHAARYRKNFPIAQHQTCM